MIKLWQFTLLAFFLIVFFIPIESKAEISIPDWVKTNAGWLANGQIADSEFVAGIEYMIKEGIIQA
ncbi:MAG: hypothetical protein R3321_10660, partial [Nitrososphaeraceae archaeon]|nr:hypothetical protein [Nitrososphaeraceae archaeon]